MLRAQVVPFAALLVIFAASPLLADSVVNSERSITKLSDGVYEIRHPDAPDGFPQGNTLVVIGDRGVLVVDSGFLPSSTRLDIDQIRKWTDKPVTYLVNTHWHYDHTMGNGLYVEAFPAVQVVAQKEMQKLIRDVNPGALRRYPRRKEATELALKTGKKIDGTPLTEGERKRYELRLAGLVPTLAELKNVVEFAPNVAFDKELDIDLGHHPVQIRFLGRGNTSGDTVIYLPVEKILAAGDLLDHPVSYFFGDIPVDHVNTLKAIAQLDVDTIVPGHGEVLHGKDYLYQVIDLLTAVNTEVEKELNAGARTSDEVQVGLTKAIDVDAWRNKFVGPDPRDRNFFDVNLRALVEASFQQISTR
ncbi:MAG TPA: MBL fold metallo-hydrolase [Terriglobales bacterium]|nr:MBL fold metallo-hydrolase [Terriglobales bacterium]